MYDGDLYRWQCVSKHAAFAPRDGAGALVFEDRMWLLGGWNPKDKVHFPKVCNNEVWSSADGKTWTLENENAPWEGRHTDAAPWAPRQYHEVAVYDGRMWVMEGYNNSSGNRNDVWYSADSVHWHEVPNTPWAPRHAASVFVFRGALWMVAGNNMTSDVWKLVRTS